MGGGSTTGGLWLSASSRAVGTRRWRVGVLKKTNRGERTPYR
jgi:hypothetical protein